MKIRTCAALLLIAGLPTAVYAVDYPEDEPNETKAQALTNRPFVLADGDSVSGISTGTSTTTTIGPSGPTADTFLLRTTPAPLGIYRHRMTLTGSGSGRVGTIRGITSSSVGPGAGDVAMQTSSAVTVPARFNQWYGFGKEEEIFYRVTGTASTTTTYTSTLSTNVVFPNAFSEPIEAGWISIQHDAPTDTAYDRDLFLFDANFNPVAGIDEPDAVSLTLFLFPGTYYIAYGRSNTAAGTASGNGVIQGTNQTGNVLDFNNLVASSNSTTSTQSVSLSITQGDTVSRSAQPLASYDVAWFRFNVLGCSDGLASLNFSGIGDGPIGDPDNSVVTGNFGVPGPINVLRVTGRMVSNVEDDSQARIQATAPDGSHYSIQPFPSGTFSASRDLIDFEFMLPSAEAGTGTWTFEFYESFDDPGIDAVWPQICFTADAVSTNPAATSSASPPVIARDGVATTTLTVIVAPGVLPSSTGLAVIVDDSSIGGSGDLALLDDGNGPDAVAGDNIFTGTTAVAYTTPLGAVTLPYTVSDDQSRSFNGLINFNVTEANGVCCLPDASCVVTTIGDCLDVQGGIFAGTGTTCVGDPSAELTSDGAGAFEDITATGTLIASLAGEDDTTASVGIPFIFNFFGVGYIDGHVSTNGNFQFGTNNSAAYTNTTIPTTETPNNALYVLWDDLDLDVTGAVRTEARGTPGVDERFIIQWNTVGQYNGGAAPLDASTFQIVLFPSGNFEYRYLFVSPESNVDTTTIGVENADGTFAIQSPLTRATLGGLTPYSLRGIASTIGFISCGPACPDCAADYDNNGGVDGGDLAAFFADFEAGESCADVDLNGGVDGGDLAFFFAVFEAGGC